MEKTHHSPQLPNPGMPFDGILSGTTAIGLPLRGARPQRFLALSGVIYADLAPGHAMEAVCDGNNHDIAFAGDARSSQGVLVAWAPR